MSQKWSGLPSGPAALLFYLDLSFTFTEANARQSHLGARSTTCCCLIPSHKPLQCFQQRYLNKPPASSTRLIVNQGENNIGVLRHSVPPHSFGPLSAQVQSCRRPLAQPSATMSGCLGKAQHCTLGQGSQEGSTVTPQVCVREKVH